MDIDHQFSDEELRRLANRFPVRDQLCAELIHLLQVLRRVEQQAYALPTPDGVLLCLIARDLEQRVSSRLAWLLNTEKHPPSLESA